MSGRKLLDRAEAATAKFLRHDICPWQVRINYSGQPYGFTLLRELMINAGMIASKGAHTDHGDVD